MQFKISFNYSVHSFIRKAKEITLMLGIHYQNSGIKTVMDYSKSQRALNRNHCLIWPTASLSHANRSNENQQVKFQCGLCGECVDEVSSFLLN